MENILYAPFQHWYHGGQVYFYSDPHFADDEMKYLRKNYIGDEEQVRRINSKVGKNDTIIFLGDIGDASYIKKVRGYKILIMGNHDAGAANYIHSKTTVTDAHYVCKKCGNVVYPDVFDMFYCDDEVAYCNTCQSTQAMTYYPSQEIDNHLFDEVYEGVLTISEKIILSHEPIAVPFMFNIHGHDHSGIDKIDDNLHFNMCAEHINYTPIALNQMVKMGMFKNVPDIHRITIDNAIQRKLKKYHASL